MTGGEIESRYEFAIRIAAIAGQLTMGYFRDHALAVEKKNDASPVTIADRECESKLRQLIEERFPADEIVGEEYGVRDGQSGYRWIIDPIDGTKSFISGVPLFGNMVAVARDEMGIIGVVGIPALGETVYAAQDRGCWWKRGDRDPQPASVSQCTRLADAKFVTTEVGTFGERGAAGVFHALEDASYIARTWGDCYGYLLVATGRADLMVDPVLNIWDAAAVQPIIGEAGGRFSDWSGLPRIDSGDAIGSNGLIHEEVLQLINRPSPLPQSND